MVPESQGLVAVMDASFSAKSGKKTFGLNWFYHGSHSRSDRPFSIRKFQFFLDNQIPETVFRAKGVLWFSESEKRHIFHLSGKRFSLDDDQWKTPERKNQLVLIGQNLDHDALRTQIENCLATASSTRGRGFYANK